MRDVFRAYGRSLVMALWSLLVAPPLVGLALIGLRLHRETIDMGNSTWNIRTPVSDQWMWIVGCTLVIGWVMAASQTANGWDVRDAVIAQEALALGAVGLSVVVSVLPWLVFWATLAAFLVVVLPMTLIEHNLRAVRRERRERIAEHERENGLR